jgi:phosphoribosylaminoimidazole-succinocarboxamide synthase
MENNFQGRDGDTLPEMSDEFVNQVSERYIELYESITGNKFEKADVSEVIDRVEKNVTEYLTSL